MLISYKWLQEMVKIPRGVTAEDIGKRLSLSTVEVEGIKNLGKNLENIVVGEIRDIKPHPNADRLRITQIDVGRAEPLKIVCGGSNLRVGQKVAVACLGARVRWHGEGELIALQPATIRGETSNGMICASTEIGLGDRFPLKEEKEILDISHIRALVGTPLSKALEIDDTIYEIDNKSLSHRPDLWGYAGIARELSALYSTSFIFKKTLSLKANKGIALNVSLQDKKLCTRYMAVAITGLKLQPSPQWMQTRLLASGVRPINAIVDVTNYVMLEIGQPMHAFDYDAIKDNKGVVDIVVRTAKSHEEFTTLDGHKHTLRDEMLLIATARKSLAVAGIMGGDLSAVSPTTETIILESATFNARSVRRTSNTLGMRTESSARFEKGLDFESARWGLERAVELYKQLFPNAQVVSAIVDKRAFKIKPITILLSIDQLKQKSGLEITLKEAINILERLGFVVRLSGKIARVTPPSFRLGDIHGSEDLIEEIMRIYGFKQVHSQMPKITVVMPVKKSLPSFTRSIKYASAFEYIFNEAKTYAFVRPRTLEILGLALDNHFMLANPLSEDRPYITSSLAVNLLEAVEKNQHENERNALFEIAPVFLKQTNQLGVDDGLGRQMPYQPVHCAYVYSNKNEKNSFAYVKDCVEGIFGGRGYNFKFKVPLKCEPWWNSGKSVSIDYNGKIIGYITVINRDCQVALGIHNETVVAEINISELLSMEPRPKRYQPVSQFPVITRDVALVFDESVSYADIISKFLKGSKFIKNVQLFDSYRGDNIGKNKKSLAFRITYQSDDRTLNTEEIDTEHKKLVEEIKRAFHALIR